MVQWWHSKIIIYNYAVVVFVDISPHLCVGFLFLVLYPAVRRPPPVVLSSSCHHTPLAHTQLVHTQLVHSQLVHTPLVITQLVITPLVITQLVITPLAHTSHHHNNLSTCPHTTCHHTTCHHTTCHHTTCHHTTCNPTTCHHTTCHHTTCHHTACSHITPWQQLVITPLDDMDCYFGWQAWHLMTWIVHTTCHHTTCNPTTCHHTTCHHTTCHHTTCHHTTCSHITPSQQLVLTWWQHFVTWTFTLRGRRGTLWYPPSLCVAGVALCDIHLHFVWQAWHLTTWIVTLRGRRGTYGTGLVLVARLVSRRRRDAAAFCVAGVALCDIHLHFVWQAWHLTTSIVTLRGRRGTDGTGLALVARLVSRRRRDAVAFCVAGVALWDIHLRFTWQAWYLDTSTSMSW